MEYVYAADFGSRVKIGYSTNVPNRIKQIETAQREKSKDLFYIQGDRDIESAIHEIFRAERIEGEWYAIPFDSAKQTLVDASQNPGKYRGSHKQKYTEARKEGNRKWDAANLDRVSIAMARGKKDEIKAAAAAAGESMNQYIVTAIDQRIERDKQEGGD